MRHHLIERADRLAETWHAGQTRKDGVTPYITHPRRVAAMLDGQPPAVIAVALLHDTLEDTAIPSREIHDLGGDILAGVWWLTSPDKEGSRLASLCREDRKAMQREKIAHAPRWVISVKLADRLDNLRDGVGAFDAEFLAMYREETRLLLRAILDTHRGVEFWPLWNELRDAALTPSASPVRLDDTAAGETR